MNIFFRRATGAEDARDKDALPSEAPAVDRLLNTTLHASRLEDRLSALLSLRAILNSSTEHSSVKTYTARSLFAGLALEGGHANTNTLQPAGVAYFAREDGQTAKALQDVIVLSCFHSASPHYDTYAELLIRRHTPILEALCLHPFAVGLLHHMVFAGEDRGHEFVAALIADFLAERTLLSGLLPLQLFSNGSKQEVLVALHLWEELFSCSRQLQNRALYEGLVEGSFAFIEATTDKDQARACFRMLSRLVQGNFAAQHHCVQLSAALAKFTENPCSVHLHAELTDHSLPPLIAPLVGLLVASPSEHVSRCLQGFLSKHLACREALNRLIGQAPVRQLIYSDHRDVIEAWLVPDNRDAQLTVLNQFWFEDPVFKDTLHRGLAAGGSLVSSRTASFVSTIAAMITNNSDAMTIWWRDFSSCELKDSLMLHLIAQSPLVLRSLYLGKQHQKAVSLLAGILQLLQLLAADASTCRQVTAWLTAEEEQFVPLLLEWLITLDARFFGPLLQNALALLLILLGSAQAAGSANASQLQQQLGFLKQRLGVHALLRLLGRGGSICLDYEYLEHVVLECPPKTPLSTRRSKTELQMQLESLQRNNEAMLQMIDQLQREQDALLLGQDPAVALIHPLHAEHAPPSPQSAEHAPPTHSRLYPPRAHDKIVFI